MSLSSTWRDRRSQAEFLAEEEIDGVFRAVQESGDRILVQFDEKELEEDIEGKVVKRSRLVVVVSSPWLQREQLVSVLPLESKTGALSLNNTNMKSTFLQAKQLLKKSSACSYNIRWKGWSSGRWQTPLQAILVVGVVQSQFFRLVLEGRSGIYFYVTGQELLGYAILVIPCGHHVQELIPKHLTRLLSGRPTTGPGETLFLKFHNSRNEVQDLIGPDILFKVFSYEDYSGTPIEGLAIRTRNWAERELQLGSFARGYYRWIQEPFFISYDAV